MKERRFFTTPFLLKLYILSFFLGISSVIVQIVFMRELVTVFYGNETIYALILAVWLFWVGVGSFIIGAFRQRQKSPLWLLVIIQFFLYISLPTTIFASRCIKQFMHLHIGEIIGIVPAFVSIFILLAPSAFLFGAMFSSLCKLSIGNNKSMVEEVEGIGSLYLWESAGSALGGLIFGFFLVHYFTAVEIIFFIGILNLVAGIFVLSRVRTVRICLLIFILGSLILYICGWVDRFDVFSRKIQWKGTTIEEITDSIYGNIVLTRLGSEYNLFENGLFSFSTKDDLSAETRVHYAMLAHPSPKKVLLIGGGIGGAVREILKYHIARLDYVELDPKVILVSQQYLPTKIMAPLQDDRVRIIHMDGRMFVKSARGKYDVIIINLPDPMTAMVNRYYTFEFFQEVKRILTPSGLLSLSVSSSENYLSTEQRQFLRSIYSTLKKVFSCVKVVPTDTAVFVASNNKEGITLLPEVLAQRLKERNINTRYVREYYLPYQLSPDRRLQMQEILDKKIGEINTDMRPISYLYDILLWSTHFNTYFKALFTYFKNISLYYFMAIPVLFFIFGLFFIRKGLSVPVSFSILTTGFSEIIFQVVVIIGFQSLYGYAYYKISIIIASFMLGLFLGSLSAKRIIVSSFNSIFNWYKITQFSICIYPLLLPFIFVIFRNFRAEHSSSIFFASVFASLPVIAGFIGGMQYPMATYLLSSDKIVKKNSMEAIKGRYTPLYAGVLYSFDSLGAAIGAVIAATFFIPIFGIRLTTFFCSLLNFSIFLLLILG